MHQEIAHDGVISTEVGTAKPDHKQLRQALLERPVPPGQVLRRQGSPRANGGESKRGLEELSARVHGGSITEGADQYPGCRSSIAKRWVLVRWR